MQRMGVRQDFGQFQGPMGSQLLIQQSLRLAEIGDAQKRVVFLLVSDAGLVQLTGQPVAAVKAEVDLKGKPGTEKAQTCRTEPDGATNAKLTDDEERAKGVRLGRRT